MGGVCVWMVDGGWLRYLQIRLSTFSFIYTSYFVPIYSLMYVQDRVPIFRLHISNKLSSTFTLY